MRAQLGFSSMERPEEYGGFHFAISGDDRKGKCRGKGVYASLFGVGAPEVLVIGVVALLVFGPKGLAEVARNLGKTLRAFQPTIRELQEVSREFKSTLEREIGLDDIDTPVPKRSNASEAPDSPKALDSNEETASVAPPPKALDTTEETSSITPPPENPDSKTLQEAAAGAPTGSASNTET
ncbi:hypothetical protein SASPL_129432 [Salvia splendens]|uniref:Sec-independent protein translocase protein TatA n=1 Tax=Salvia splendens TaxID=180675 RepID=A0A8X8XCR4_SALSN|nr:hypothetical protein SASPL_129432 [Salvia splendens]